MSKKERVREFEIVVYQQCCPSCDSWRCDYPRDRETRAIRGTLRVYEWGVEAVGENADRLRDIVQINRVWPIIKPKR
jgi:hypothetical protein